MKCDRCQTNAFVRGQCYACGYEGMQTYAPEQKVPPKIIQLSLLDYAPDIECSIAVLRERA